MKDQDEPDPHTNRSAGNKSGAGTGEFTQAMGRLEQAVQDLVKVTTGEIGDRATSVINETSKRLEAELRLKVATGEDPEVNESQVRRRRRHRSRHWFNDDWFNDDGESKYTTLYIDRADEKIAGVCAAFARYLGVENWVVRMAALTGLVFVPGIVFPGYWIAYFVIEKRHTQRTRRKSRRSRRRARSARMSGEDRMENNMQDEPDKKPAGDNETTRGRGSPRPDRSLRHVATDLTQAELRLRRVESFVTSNQYELHKELAKIDTPSGAQS